MNEKIEKLQRAFKIIKETNNRIDDEMPGAFQMTEKQFEAYEKMTESLIYARNYINKAIDALADYEKASEEA